VIVIDARSVSDLHAVRMVGIVRYVGVHVSENALNGS
jgi:hypothetical protein